MPGSYVEMMMDALLRAQEAQRAALRQALSPGGDTKIVEKIMLGMEAYL